MKPTNPNQGGTGTGGFNKTGGQGHGHGQNQGGKQPLTNPRDQRGGTTGGGTTGTTK